MNSATILSDIRKTVCRGSVAIALALSVNHLSAGDVIRADTSSDLNLDAAWTTVAPTSSDVAVWDTTMATPANGTSLLGADLSWQGIRIAGPSGAITINAGNTLTLGTAGIDMSAALQNLTLGNAVSLGAAQIWNVGSGRTLTVSGAVTESSAGNGITKTGAGTLAISGSSSFADGITVNDGVVSVSGGTMPIILNGGTFSVGAALSTPVNVTANGGTVSVTANRTLSGAFTGSGTANVSVGGANTTLSFGANVFSGFNGTIALGSSIGGIRANSSAFAGSADTAFDLGSSTGYYVRNNSAATVSFGSLSGAAGTQVRGNNNVTYSIGGLNTDSTFSGDIQAPGAGSVNVVKVGAGILTLAGNNGYNGTTTVSGGTLRVNGTLAATSALTVDVAGRLSGVGTINGGSIINGEIAPGSSIGTLTFNSTLQLNGVTTMELDRDNSQNADLLNVAGTLTLGGTLNVVNIGSALQAGDTFNLFDGNINGSSYFTSTNLPMLVGLSWDVSQLNTFGIISVVPEPPPLTLGIASGAALFYWRHRSRKVGSKHPLA